MTSGPPSFWLHRGRPSAAVPYFLFVPQLPDQEAADSSSASFFSIFARFIPEVLEIIKRSERIIGKSGMKTVAIYGAIPKEQRGDIVQQFQKDPSTMVLVGQIDTAGTGITLTAADTCVYYSVTFNYATYSQSLARIHRIGQRNTCTYIHLVAENTVDSTILKSLSKKEDLAKTVVDDWRQFF